MSTESNLNDPPLEAVEWLKTVTVAVIRSGQEKIVSEGKMIESAKQLAEIINTEIQKGFMEKIIFYSSASPMKPILVINASPSDCTASPSNVFLAEELLNNSLTGPKSVDSCVKKSSPKEFGKRKFNGRDKWYEK